MMHDEERFINFLNWKMIIPYYQDDEDDLPKYYEDIAFLVTANGGFESENGRETKHQYGHKKKLNEQELSRLQAYHARFIDCEEKGIKAFELFKPYYDKYIDDYISTLQAFREESAKERYENVLKEKESYVEKAKSELSVF